LGDIDFMEKAEIGERRKREIEKEEKQISKQ
jgi:hypothetical protein